MAYININLKCVTFNCFGFKNSSSFINSLCESYDRCFLNEHFLKPYEIATVKEELKERNLWSFLKSSVDYIYTIKDRILRMNYNVENRIVDSVSSLLRKRSDCNINILRLLLKAF